MYIFHRRNLPDEDFQLGEVDASVAGTTLEHTCDQFPFCPAGATRYRNIDGKCNHPNPERGAWGAAGSPMYVQCYGILIFNEKIKNLHHKCILCNDFIFCKLFSGNDCCHQAMKMAFGGHGKISGKQKES